MSDKDNQSLLGGGAGGVSKEQTADSSVDTAAPPRARGFSITSNVSDVAPIVVPKGDVPLHLGYNFLLMLFAIGVVTGAVNGCAIWAGKMISLSQALLIQSNAAGPFFFIVTAAIYVAASAYAVKLGKTGATIGPGIPEIKALLDTDFHRSDFPTIVSFKISCVRLFSIVTAVGSGLSLGIAAPLAHCSICTAYTLMNLVPDFGEFLENHAIRKQIFTAAAAVGFTSSFHTPVGGLLLCIELTSTFYMVSNYWRSFFVVVSGGVVCSFLLLARHDQGRMYYVPYIERPFVRWEFLTFAALSVLCGLLALQYLKLHRFVSHSVKPYTLKYPVATAAFAGGLTALLIYAVGAYNAEGVTETIIVHDLFQDAHLSTMRSRPNVNPMGALFASLLVHVVLALLGTNIRISSGILLPVITLGALVGRIFGEVLSEACGDSAIIYVGGYAMVGAVALISGATHTVSIAVIVIEQTGQFGMLFPCLLGAVIACGITKSRSLSLYDQGMVMKGIESFDLLLKESGGFKYAADVLDEKVNSVHAKCTVGELFELLGPTLKQSTFPVTSSARSYRLVGCVDRRDVFNYLKTTFESEGLYTYVRQRLPADAHYDDKRTSRMRRIEQRRALFTNPQSLFRTSKAEHSELGPAFSPSKGWFGVLNRPKPRRRYSFDVTEDANPGSDADDGYPDESDYEDHDIVDWVDEGTRRGSAVVNPLLSPNPVLSVKATELDDEADAAVHVPDSPLLTHRPSWSLQGPPSETLQHLTDGLKENFRTLQHRVAQLPAEIGLPVPVDPNSPKSVHFSAAQLAKIQALLDKSLDVTQEPQLSLNSFPFTAHRYTTMDQLYVLFEMVKVHVVFVVTNTKRLEGMISKDKLMQHLKKKMK
jgi:H+/Cl- antiporter ClcA